MVDQLIWDFLLQWKMQVEDTRPDGSGETTIGLVPGASAKTYLQIT